MQAAEPHPLGCRATIGVSQAYNLQQASSAPSSETHNSATSFMPWPYPHPNKMPQLVPSAAVLLRAVLELL